MISMLYFDPIVSPIVQPFVIAANLLAKSVTFPTSSPKSFLYLLALNEIRTFSYENY